MKRSIILVTVMVVACLLFAAGCSSSGGSSANPSGSSSVSSAESTPTEYVNATFKAFSMDVPAKWVEKYREAELKNDSISLRSDDSSTPDAFMIISHFTSRSPNASVREVTSMTSLTGDAMEPIDVDGAEGGINYSFTNDYHKVEVLFYTPDDTTQVRIAFSYKDSAKEAWEKYADELYKSIRLN